jgi:CRISPR/Cas system-associated endonuclease Cas3-HD
MRHNRNVKISKAKLIEKIKENKINHVKEYEEAIVAYVEEANKQLLKAKSELDNGSLKIVIHLTTPINRSDEYDKVVEMFVWEVQEEIELTQLEFNEYVHDDNDQSRNAKIANKYYSSSH